MTCVIYDIIVAIDCGLNAHVFSDLTDYKRPARIELKAPTPGEIMQERMRVIDAVPPNELIDVLGGDWQMDATPFESLHEPGRLYMAELVVGYMFDPVTREADSELTLRNIREIVRMHTMYAGGQAIKMYETDTQSYYHGKDTEV